MPNRLKVCIWLILVLTLAIPAGPSSLAKTKPEQADESAAQTFESYLKGDQPPMDRPALQIRNPRYRLRRGDRLQLNFPFVSDFNQTVTILPDGYITLRLLGDHFVAGKTMPELTQMLQFEYGKILREPVLTIELQDYEKPYFIVSGKVARPGKYDLRGNTTVSQAVAIAGDFTENAKHSQILLFRRVSDEWVQVKKLDLKKMLRQADLSEDLHLQPGDMLFVPQNALSKIKPFLPRADALFWIFR